MDKTAVTYRHMSFQPARIFFSVFNINLINSKLRSRIRRWINPGYASHVSGPLVFTRGGFCSAKSGIMMVEVLLAMLIVTVGLTVVVQSLSQALGATVFSSDYTMAALAADNAVSRVLIEQAGAADAMAAAGDSSSAEEKFHTASTVGAVEGNVGTLQLLKVDVSWHSGSHDKSLEVVTYQFSQKSPGT